MISSWIRAVVAEEMGRVRDKMEIAMRQEVQDIKTLILGETRAELTKLATPDSILKGLMECIEKKCETLEKDVRSVAGDLESYQNDMPGADDIITHDSFKDVLKNEFDITDYDVVMKDDLTDYDTLVTQDALGEAIDGAIDQDVLEEKVTEILRSKLG